MADQMPPNDPLDNRLRATFAAERDDLERRHMASGASPARTRSLKWIPLAIAAALVAIAGFAFIGNRSTDQAIELEVAAQPPDGQPQDGVPTTTGPPVPVDQNGQPVPPPVGQPSPVGMPIPYISGENMCGDFYRDTEAFAIGVNNASVPALAEPETSGEIGVTRLLDPGLVELAGGCTRGTTPQGITLQWYEIKGPPGAPNDWVLSSYLVWVADPALGQAPANNECGVGISSTPHFVWDIPADDPDGGLVAHTAAGVDEPITRVIPRNHMVTPTQGCVLTANGSAWFEVRAPNGSTEWVNSKYLQAAQVACLVGEQQGTRSRSGLPDEPFFHVAAPGETLTSIAEKFRVSVEVLVQDNPQLDVVEFGTLIRVPRATEEFVQLLGPADGLAVADGERVAFVPTFDRDDLDFRPSPLSEQFRWYPAEGVVLGAACFQEDQEVGTVCLTGDIRLIDLQQPEPVWSGQGPIVALRTGRVIGPPQGPGDTAWIEVSVASSTGEVYIGLIDPTQVLVTDGNCVSTTVSNTLEADPCMRVAGQPPGSVANAGDPSSSADHVHDIRAESNDTCTRVVITFGQNANEDDLDTVSATLPPLIVERGLQSVTISPDGWPMESAFLDPDRIDYPGGIGLLSLSPGFEFAVELMHDPMEPNVRFFSDPARVVIDLFPLDSPAAATTGPFGERFVLRQPIQLDPTGQGIPADNDIVVEGFGRPFEAAGLYRIWAVPDEVDAGAFLDNPPAPLIEDFFPTSGWAEGWGQFFVPLPDLAPGTYIAVFGELPPTDEIGFYGTGQLFRVSDSPTEEPGTWPQAVLLPDVQLPPE